MIPITRPTFTFRVLFDRDSDHQRTPNRIMDDSVRVRQERLYLATASDLGSLAPWLLAFGGLSQASSIHIVHSAALICW